MKKISTNFGLTVLSFFGLRSICKGVSLALHILLLPAMLISSSAPLVASTPTDSGISEEEFSHQQNYSFSSYDDILDLLDDLESGELEERCSEEQLETLTNFLITLAKEGNMTCDCEESLYLEEDIEELLAGDVASFDDLFYFDTDSNYTLTSAIMQDCPKGYLM